MPAIDPSRSRARRRLASLAGLGLFGLALGALVLSHSKAHAASMPWAARILASSTNEVSPTISAVSPDAVAAIAKDLNCPLCQGYSLQDCPLEVCAQMRELIGTRLAEGQSRDEIVSAFVRDYGPQVLASPPAEGFYLFAWVLPALILVAGLVAAAMYLRRGVKESATASSAAVTETDENLRAAVDALASRDA